MAKTAKRRTGRVFIDKVDIHGKKITDITKWRLQNPTSEVFDSKLEQEVYVYLCNENINFIFHPDPVIIGKSVNTLEFVKGELKKVKQQHISYTPDFHFPDLGIYIETKGYLDDVFRLRWKLFKIHGNEGYLAYSLNDVKTILSKIDFLKNEE